MQDETYFTNGQFIVECLLNGMLNLCGNFLLLLRGKHIYSLSI